jgi:hypothetical protein
MKPTFKPPPKNEPLNNARPVSGGVFLSLGILALWCMIKIERKYASIRKICMPYDE